MNGDALRDGELDGELDGERRLTWRLREGETWYATVEAPDAAAALEVARGNVAASNYNDMAATIWIRIRVQCEETGEEDADWVRLDPPVPKCSDHDGGHDWQAEIAMPPAIEAGFRIHEICTSCDCHRVTDTRAIDPVTGRQGLESVSYPRGTGGA